MRKHYSKFYGIYRKSRNASWQLICDLKIKCLPVNLNEICKALGIIILLNSNVELLKSGEYAALFHENNKFYIVYDDTVSNTGMLRFTIAHEIGHFVLGHAFENNNSAQRFVDSAENETAAKMFAARILAPACVLHELKILDQNGIRTLCNISDTAAAYREKRMAELERRNKWYTDPLEREVYYMFEDFIKNYYK